MLKFQFWKSLVMFVCLFLYFHQKNKRTKKYKYTTVIQKELNSIYI